ncbi:MAG: thioredoxin domain-containing protein [Ginsengibacter sp.]
MGSYRLLLKPPHYKVSFGLCTIRFLNNRTYLVRSSFSGFAEEIELDTTTFENSREHKKLIHKVINDFESGVKGGVDGTPTFFINGHRYNGLDDFNSLYRTCKYAMNFTDALF